VDATTLEANAAMRSIVRKDSKQNYQAFLTDLAKASGIETPTREDLAKIDKNRKNKGSNDDWENPNDPDAKITKMKDGRTHLAHKAEHAVDMDSGAVLAVTIQQADQGDTTTWRETIEETWQNINTVKEEPELKDKIHADPGSEIVADKGYHSNQVLCDFEEIGIRSYIAEPGRGRRKWKDRARERDAVYANRRRIRGNRGRRLMKKRGELIERSFAHGYETGGMRRTHLRHHCNILKRLLIHMGGFNLALVMRKLTGIGKPRRSQGRRQGVCALILCCISAVWMLLEAARHMMRQDQRKSLWPTKAALAP
jgi:transposase